MSDQTPEQTPASPSSPAPAPKHARHRCAVCGKEARNAIRLDALRPEIAALISVDHPDLKTSDCVCANDIGDYRTRYVSQLLERERGELSDLDKEVVESLAKQETIAEDVESEWEDRRTFGERIADVVADFGGSWTFIGSFFAVLVVWMTYNVWAVSKDVFDPYPFILLNLVLSCLAAIQAPIIMMSQKRQEAKDRLRGENDYKVNLKAELEIRHLHEKIDHLINRQWERLAEIQQIQLEIMEDMAKHKR
jgi:uncharacterized membrane protein